MCVDYYYFNIYIILLLFLIEYKKIQNLIEVEKKPRLLIFHFNVGKISFTLGQICKKRNCVWNFNELSIFLS